MRCNSAAAGDSSIGRWVRAARFEPCSPTATISSVARTDSPSATTRVARCSIAAGSGSIELAVLAKKAVSRVYDIEPDYYGFDVGDKWIVGMGMDDARAGNEHYRWLDEIWEVAQDDDPPMKAELVS